MALRNPAHLVLERGDPVDGVCPCRLVARIVAGMAKARVEDRQGFLVRAECRVGLTQLIEQEADVTEVGREPDLIFDDRSVIAGQCPRERHGLLERLQRLCSPARRLLSGAEAVIGDGEIVLQLSENGTALVPDGSVALRRRFAGIAMDMSLKNQHGLLEGPERRGELAQAFLFMTIGASAPHRVDGQYRRLPDWREPAAPGSARVCSNV